MASGLGRAEPSNVWFGRAGVATAPMPAMPRIDAAGGRAVPAAVPAR